MCQVGSGWKWATGSPGLVTFCFLIRVLVTEMCTVCEHSVSCILKTCVLSGMCFTSMKCWKQTRKQIVFWEVSIFSLEKSRQTLRHSPIHRARNETRGWAARPIVLQIEYTRGQFPTLIIYIFKVSWRKVLFSFAFAIESHFYCEWKVPCILQTHL